MQITRRGGFRRFAVLIAVAAAGVLVVGAHAASAGTYEICKSGANGMAGQTFHFTVQPLVGGLPVGSSVGHDIKPLGAGYTCTGPQNLVGVSQVTITESDVTTTSEVAAIIVIPISRKVGSENLAAKSVTVNLGTTTANETQIRYINQPLGGTSGVLKVCKLTETPAFLGRQFSFTVNGGPAMSTPANDAFGDPTFWTCRILGTFQVNSVVRVRELIPAGTQVKYIDTDPGLALVDFNTNDCSVTPTPTELTCGESFVRVGAGTTVVLYDDEPIVPSGTGFIEICKNPPGFQDAAVTGSWHFTITDADGFFVTSRDVLTNQCTDAIQVPAGIVTVTETPRTGYQLTNVFTNPVDALVNSNILNRTADVEVPTTDDPTQEVLVSFVNEAIRTQLKICKALGPASADLVGQTFNFTVTNITDPNNPVPLGTASVTTASTTQCVPFGTVPTGTVVQVDEVFGPDNPLTPFDESGEFIDQSGPATTTIGAGTANTVTITNTARGVMEVCKDLVVGVTPQPTFQFRIDGGAIFNVTAGGCSQPRRVSVGNHTVLEIAAADYEVSAITVNPADRLVGTANLATRTVTVSVPYGPNGETVVTYTNRIRTGTFKVCKHIPTTSINGLSGKTYTYTLNVMIIPGNPGVFATTVVTLDLPLGATDACTGFFGPYPVIQTDGSKTIIGVQETLSGGFVVDSIVPTFTRGLCSGTAPAPGPYPGQNCIPGGRDLATGNINFFLGPGPQFVTFTNRAV